MGRRRPGGPHQAGEGSIPRECTSLVEAGGTAGEVVVVEAIGEVVSWAALAVWGVALGLAVLVLERWGHHFGFHEAAEVVVDRTRVVEVDR